METIKKGLRWLVISSQNPQKVSMTVKGALMVSVPFVVQFSGLLNLATDQESLKVMVEQVASLVNTGLTFIGTSYMLYGIVRKMSVKPASNETIVPHDERGTI